MFAFGGYERLITFKVEIEQEEDGRWLAGVVELPGVFANGDSQDAAVSKVQALALRLLAGRLEHGEAGPESLHISFSSRRTRGPTTTANGSDQSFIANVYPEIKDLGKQFLTLVSGVLAFTVTFAEKIIDFATASSLQKYLLLLSWLFFIGSVTAVGVGLWWNYNSSISALRGDSGGTWKTTRTVVYPLFLGGGFSFVFGLFFLGLAAATRMHVFQWLEWVERVFAS